MGLVEHLRAKVAGAMTYPIVLIVVCFVLFVAFSFLIAPTFRHVFADFQTEMPWATTFVIETSEFGREHWLTVVVVFALLVVGLVRAVRWFMPSGVVESHAAPDSSNHSVSLGRYSANSVATAVWATRASR